MRHFEQFDYGTHTERVIEGGGFARDISIYRKTDKLNNIHRLTNTTHKLCSLSSLLISLNRRYTHK